MVLLIMVVVYRRMEHKAPLRVTGKTMGMIFLSILGALMLGIGMCLAMVWEVLVAGIVIGIVGIVLLFMLIPLYKGIQYNVR